MTLQVVAGVQSREFLLATVDHKIEQARTRRDYYRAAADQAVIDGAPVMEQLSLARADTTSEFIDMLLARRFRLTSEAL